MQRLRFSAQNNEQALQFAVYNSDQNDPFLRRSGNRQCRKGSDVDDLADFAPITTKSWFIKETSWYDYAIVNQNFVGIGPNSAVPIRLNERAGVWYFMSLKTNTLALLWIKKSEIFHFRFLPTLDLGRHRKLERLLSFFLFFSSFFLFIGGGGGGGGGVCAESWPLDPNM